MAPLPNSDCFDQSPMHCYLDSQFCFLLRLSIVTGATGRSDRRFSLVTRLLKVAHYHQRVPSYRTQLVAAICPL